MILEKRLPDDEIAALLGITVVRVQGLRKDWNSGRAIGALPPQFDLEDTDEL